MGALLRGQPLPGGRGDNGADYDYAFKTFVAPYRNGGTVLMINPVNSGYVGIGTNAPQTTLHVAGDLLVEGSITGNGSDLMTLDASNLLSGTVADARLSTNVPLLSRTNTFSGTNVFTGVVNFTGAFYGSPPYLKYVEVTQPGDSVDGTNNWREFTTELSDTHNLGSLSSGDINLPAGTYQCRISAPGFRVESHQIRLRTSTSSNLLYGTIGYSDNSTEGSQDRSQIEGQFALPAAATLRVQHYCRLAHADGLGTYQSFNWGDGDQPIFAVAEFWKIK